MSTAASPLDAPWSPDSWRARPAAQQPDWPDDGSLDAVLAELSGLPPLVFAGEARSLTESLGRVAEGKAFLLQAGDCAESFSAFSADGIRDKLKIILQMSVLLTYGAGVPTVKVGRIAGQFAKPRSSSTERARRGRAARASAATWSTTSRSRPRRGAPTRPACCRGYHQSASTLNLLRAFTKGGYADLSRVHAWNQDFVDRESRGPALRGRRGRDRAGPAVHGGLRDRPRQGARRSTRSTATPPTRRCCSATRRRSPARTASAAVGTTARRTCSGSVTAPASSTARTSSSWPACRTRSA